MVFNGVVTLWEAGKNMGQKGLMPTKKKVDT